MLPIPIFLQDFHIMVQILENHFISSAGPFSVFSSDFPLFQSMFMSVRVRCSLLLDTKQLVNWMMELNISTLSMKNITRYLSRLIIQANWQPLAELSGGKQGLFHRMLVPDSLAGICAWVVVVIQPVVLIYLVLVCADLTPFVYFLSRPMARLCKTVISQS